MSDEDKNSPLVSIIIPCYNAEKYVAEAIQSALDQTYPHCEVIVIDDGSTDGSLEVINSFGDKIRWETGPNKGGCAARNRGLAIAKGDWIQFLDADDLLDTRCVNCKIERAINCDDRYVVFCSICEILDTELSRMCSEQWFSTTNNRENYIKIGTPPTCAPLHSRWALESVGGFREGLSSAQEFDLHLRMSLLFGIKFKTVLGSKVVIRPQIGSVSRQSSPRLTQNIYTILKGVLIDNISTGVVRLNEKELEALNFRMWKSYCDLMRWRCFEQANECYQYAEKLGRPPLLEIYNSRLFQLIGARILGIRCFEEILYRIKQIAQDHNKIMRI